MALLGIDIGGTKLAMAIFKEDGTITFKDSYTRGNLKGSELGKFITDKISHFIHIVQSEDGQINSVGISVPGISNIKSGTVWAPNIPGWTNYPLLQEVKSMIGNIPVTIESDRACYILGELWKGNARGCRDAIFLSVGTGIGAGILVNGEILRGSNDIAGCIGWMALKGPFEEKYSGCGCFEYFASGEGISKVAVELLEYHKDYAGDLKNIPPEKLTTYDVFKAYDNGDQIAEKVIQMSVEFWGMAVANLVSLFNPEKILIGGGVFGPAIQLIPAIRNEAGKWAQPVGIKQVSIEPSALAGDAGVYGAGYIAYKQLVDFNMSK